MTTPHKMQVKIGAHEFAAEGLEETVKAQFQLFLQAITTTAAATPPVKPSREEKPSPAGDGAGGDGTPKTLPPNFNYERAFRDDDRNGIVSLRTLPTTNDRDLDTVILLIYGIQKLNDEHEASALEVMTGARQSGLTIVRLDRLLAQRPELVRKGGKRRGTRYSLTNLGVNHAERLLQEMFS